MKAGLFSGGPPSKLYGWLRLRSHAEKRATSLGLLPLLPVVLMVLPLDVVVKDLAKFLI
jgi:hypothetical protein